MIYRRCPQCSKLLCADDTTFTIAGSDYDNIIDTFNVELHTVKQWFHRNRLTLNKDKTFAINFSFREITNNQKQLFFDNSKINFETTGKYLGIMLDSMLSFGNHVRYTCSKVSKSVGIIYRVSSFAPRFVLLKLYYSFVYPYLTYCCLCWGGAAAFHLDQLLLLQKKLVRIINGNDYLADEELHKYICAVYAYKNKHLLRVATHSYSTRSQGLYVLEYQRLVLTQRSVSYALPSMYNELPPDVREAQTLREFRCGVQEYFVLSYDN